MWWLGLPEQSMVTKMIHRMGNKDRADLHSCKNCPDMVFCHNRIQDTLLSYWVYSSKQEAAWVMKHSKRILLISSSLTGSWASLQQLILASFQVMCVMSGSAAMQAEKSKHHSNDAECRELGWVCIPLVVYRFFWMLGT